MAYNLRVFGQSYAGCFLAGYAAGSGFGLFCFGNFAGLACGAVLVFV